MGLAGDDTLGRGDSKLRPVERVVIQRRPSAGGMTIMGEAAGPNNSAPPLCFDGRLRRSTAVNNRMPPERNQIQATGEEMEDRAEVQAEPLSRAQTVRLQNTATQASPTARRTSPTTTPEEGVDGEGVRPEGSRPHDVTKEASNAGSEAADASLREVKGPMRDQARE